jgi:dihydroorotate dehydrogenase
MSLLPYALARPFLFGLDPETAHELTMHSLARLQGTPLEWAYCNGLVEDPVELAGLKFPNRVGLAAGLDKNARCIDGLGAMGFGFVEVGTVTPKASPATPSRACSACRNPRADQPAGLQQRRAGRLSWPTCSAQTSARRAHPGPEHRQERRHADRKRHRDYLTCLDGVYPHADYVTVNISSPNTKNLRALQSDEALDACWAPGAAPRGAGHAAPARVPLFVKIAPDLDEAQVDVIAATLQAPRMDGVVATNTTISRDAVQRPAPCRRGRRPERRAGVRSQQPRHRASCARRWARAFPSSAWAAS